MPGASMPLLQQPGPSHRYRYSSRSLQEDGAFVDGPREVNRETDPRSFFRSANLKCFLLIGTTQKLKLKFTCKCSAGLQSEQSSR